METKNFFKKVEKVITDIVAEKHFFTYECKSDIKVIPVWYCKTIQNHKGLFIAKNEENLTIYPEFFEVTYNGDKDEFYFDEYVKTNKIICKGENI